MFGSLLLAQDMDIEFLKLMGDMSTNDVGLADVGGSIPPVFVGISLRFTRIIWSGSWG